MKCGLSLCCPGLSEALVLQTFCPSIRKTKPHEVGAFCEAEIILLDERNKYSYDEMSVEKHLTPLKRSEFDFIWRPSILFGTQETASDRALKM